jgi:NADPH:quinone reductase-like Zn-dependent oxidoreductase
MSRSSFASTFAAVTAVSSKQAQLKQLGIQQFLNAGETNAVFDIVLDPVAGSEIDNYVNLLAPNGRYLLSGAAAGFPSPDFGSSWIQRFLKSLSFMCLSLNSISQQEMNMALTEIFSLCAGGEITSVIDSIYSLDDAAAAHRKLESGKVFGKIILAIN